MLVGAIIAIIAQEAALVYNFLAKLGVRNHNSFILFVFFITLKNGFRESNSE